MRETRTECGQKPLVPATAAGRGLGCLPLGSAQSRATARLLAARKVSEEDGLRFEVRSLVDGQRVNLDDASGPDSQRGRE